ncbi:unnamed protein product [Orchesella dallaii]|uniref:C2H2-type domain-containing protein n=1 Tax=Orchesella dallaii TaxID=48710 RepID=A0ABP1RVP2_9HEXA
MTVNVCLVCLNHFNYESSSIPSEHDDNSFLLKRFLKFVQNYLQISSDTGSFFPKLIERQSFCEKCELAVISPICQVYQDFLSTQLRLSWELGQLAKLLDNSKRSGSSVESKFSKLKSLSLQLGIDRISGVNQFRTLLTKNCKLKRKETLPFIPLQRCKTPAKATVNFDAAFGFERSCQNWVANSPEVATVPVLQDENSLKIEGEFLFGDNDADVDDDVSYPLEHSDATDPMQLPGNAGPKTDSSKDFTIKAEGDEMGVEKRLIKIKIYHDDNEDSRLVQTREEFDIDKDTKFEMRLIHNQENFICPHCKRSFPRKGNLNTHIVRMHPQSHHRGKNCPICLKKFQSREQLKNHMRFVHVGRRHTCSYCKASFKQQTHLKEHIASIHKPTPSNCKLCGKVLKNRKYLNEHMACSHPDPAKQQNWPKCPKCKKQFWRQDRLKRHIRICS